MGSSITSTIVNTTPMFSTLLAIGLLEERPGALVLLGVVLTVGGLATVSWVGGQSDYKKNELIYPFLCALIFSLKDVTVRWALGAGDGQPIFSAGIAALTSTIQIFLITRYVQGEKFVVPPWLVARWFVWSGIFTGGSFLFMYLALSMERVTIVAPLINSYAVFVLLLTPFMARQIETSRHKKSPVPHWSSPVFFSCHSARIDAITKSEEFTTKSASAAESQPNLDISRKGERPQRLRRLRVRIIRK